MLLPHCRSQPQKHKETKSHIESDVPKNSLKLNKLQKLLSLSATKVPAKLADIDFEFEIEDPKQQAPIEMESLIQVRLLFASFPNFPLLLFFHK